VSVGEDDPTAAISGSMPWHVQKGSTILSAPVRDPHVAELDSPRNRTHRVPQLSVASVRNFLNGPDTPPGAFSHHFDIVLSAPGVLASEVLGPIRSKLKDLQG